MAYLLVQVEDQLRKAFERAKEQVQKGNVLSKVELGPDIGHEKALTTAQKAPVIADSSSYYKPRLVQRGRFRCHMEPKKTGDIYDCKLHVPDHQPYPVFLLWARLYLVLRGIPQRARHKTKRGRLKPGHRATWTLYVTEEALDWAGIQLQFNNYSKQVPHARGAIRSPWIGKIERAIEPPPSNGGQFVHEGQVVFVIRVWPKPGISELHDVKTPVGGSVPQVVRVKRGDMVEKNQLLIQLDSPFVDTSPF